MKFLRSLFRKKSAEPEAPAPKKETPRAAYRSPFSPAAGGDGFEAGARKPVDLTGGMKVQFAPPEVEVAETAPAPESDFAASLEDLGLLMEGREQVVDQPDPPGFTADPLDVFEPANPFQPIDSFESAPEAAPVAVNEVDEPEPEAEPPAEIEVAPPLAPVAVASPATTAPAPDPVVAQHTVALLMPIEPQRSIEPREREQFSTLDLMHIVEQLRTDEEPVKVEEAPASSPEPLPLADSTPKE